LALAEGYYRNYTSNLTIDNSNATDDIEVIDWAMMLSNASEVSYELVPEVNLGGEIWIEEEVVVVPTYEIVTVSDPSLTRVDAVIFTEDTFAT